MTPRFIFAALAILTLVIVRPAASQTAFQYPEASQALESRFDWAHAEANETGASAYWIAYSVKRTMRENSWMGHFREGWEDSPSLGTVLTGAEPPVAQSLQDAARRALNGLNADRSEEMVEREIVILTLFDKDSRTMRDLDLSNIELAFDFENHPVYWLGSATDSESIAHLVETYSREKDVNVQEDLVTAVGMHEAFTLAQPFIESVIESRADNDVRESAVFWLHRDETDTTVRYLSRLAEADRSEDVRENAVFTLSRIALDAALDRLIHLARFSDDEEVGETAKFWLGQKAATILVGDLDDDDGDDGDEESEIQKQAIFALAQFDDGGGVDELIALVHTHRNPVVRKQALFWLGQSESDRALDTIISILRPGS